MAEPIQVDLEAVKADIAKMSSDQMVAELTKLTVRRKVQQKKHQGSSQQKQYQAKQREKAKQLKELALAQPRTDGKPGNLWEQINEQAEVEAQAKIDAAKEVAEAEQEEGDEEAA